MSAVASMLFDSWTGLGRVLLVGILAYVALVAILRISGKRTLTKLNAFDLVVTVALGSTLATVLLSKDVALLEGILAMAVLVFLQYAITWASVRQQLVKRLVKSEPTLLVHRGAILDGALRRQRVTREELLSVLRSNGAAEVEDAAAVVLETDGSFSIVKVDSSGPGSTLSGVPCPGPKVSRSAEPPVASSQSPHPPLVTRSAMATNIPRDALILVADSRKALLLRNVDGGGGVSLREERRLSPKDLLDDGPSGSRPEEQTALQTDEATFAKQLAETLYRMLQKGEFDALVLVADPQTLGQMRDAMHKEVERSVVLTLDKALTNHTIAEIARVLG